MRRIYLDNAATTPLHPEVISVMEDCMSKNFGNPSSIHHFGRKAKASIEQSRKEIAGYLNCSIGEVFFTSSATESNNLIIHQSVKNLGVTKIISSQTEHPCVVNSIKREAVDTEWVKLDYEGNVDLENLENLLKQTDGKALVSLMHSNNEIGTLLDFTAVAELCNIHNALFHTDAVQSIGKIPIDLSSGNVNFLSATGHKFHGPKGIGFMYINGDNNVDPYVVGGAQERNMRAGTENVIGIVGLAKALEVYVDQMENHKSYITSLRDRLKSGLIALVPDIQFNGNQEKYLQTILSASFPADDKADMIMFNLDINGICASAGSACSSGIEQDSPVLTAIGHDPSRKTIRFSFSHYNTIEEIDYTLEKIKSFI